jgi:thioredoxin 1
MTPGRPDTADSTDPRDPRIGDNHAMDKAFVEKEPTRAEVDAMTGPVLLEFGTPWCGWCRAAQPLIAQALALHPAVKHLRVEDGSGRPLGRSFRVKLWPTLVFLRDGREVAKLVRPADADSIGKALAQVAAAAG